MGEVASGLTFGKDRTAKINVYGLIENYKSRIY